MNERERIMQLVKDGVISSQEAIVLLENLANKADNGTEEKQSAAEEAKSAEQESADAAQEEADAQASDDLRNAHETLADLQQQLQEKQRQIRATEEQITVLDTLEDLEDLPAEKAEERSKLQASLITLKEDVDRLSDQVQAAKQVVDDLQAKTWQNAKKEFEDTDWVGDFSQTFSDFGKRMGSLGTQVGQAVRDAVTSVTDNVDWKDVKIKVPGVVSASFDHEFLFEHIDAPAVEMRIANGDIRIKPSINDNVSIRGQFKIYGHYDEPTPLAALTARSQIDVSNEHIVFSVPNKRIRADLDVYLPKRLYDHTSVKILNGNLAVDGFNGQDFYAKLTNGTGSFANVTLQLLNVEDINGTVNYDSGKVDELLAQTMNGTLTAKAPFKSAELSTVNGTIRVTAETNDLHKLVANSTSGTIKVSVPASLGLTGEAQSKVGAVRSRLSGLTSEPVRGTVGQRLTLDRTTDSGDVAELQLTAGAGAIMLKDND
jgi:DUF4097 and DUF4098 domain-containing protein YvlB